MLDQGKVSFELTAVAQRRETPTQGEASNGFMGRATLGWLANVRRQARVRPTTVRRSRRRAYRAEDLAADLRETAAVHAAVEALRVAVDQLDAEPGRDAAAAWHAASLVRFFCSTYGGAVTGVRVNEDRFVVTAATVPGDDVIVECARAPRSGTELRIPVGGRRTIVRLEHAGQTRHRCAHDIRPRENCAGLPAFARLDWRTSRPGVVAGCAADRQ